MAELQQKEQDGLSASLVRAKHAPKHGFGAAAACRVACELDHIVVYLEAFAALELLQALCHVHVAECAFLHERVI